MTAKIAGFVTRAEAGLRKPRSQSTRISPGDGGVALHYGGPPQNIGSHSDCVRTWKGWQDYHMDSHGWSDIAYSLGYCQHGYVFAGRGAGRRTAANGTNHGNENYYAAVWIGGKGQKPTQAALDAADWCIKELREAGGAGRRVVPHEVFTGTQCPGVYLKKHAAARDNADVGGSTQPKTPAGDPILQIGDRGSAVEDVQNVLIHVGHDLTKDGVFGPVTEGALKDFQKHSGLAADGIVGENTWKALRIAIHGEAPDDPKPEPKQPIQTGATGMIIVLDNDNHHQYVCDADSATHISGAERNVLLAGGVQYVGKEQASADDRRAFLAARGVEAPSK